MIKPILLIPFFLLMATQCLSQQKVEKESRINEDIVPVNAKEFIEKATELQKVKWYYEIGGNSQSYEAKCKLNKQKVSVEFSKNGAVEDVEINTCLAKFTAKAYPEIKTYFETNFTDYSVDKLQIQYIGEQDKLLKLLNTGDKENLIENYEFIVNVKENNQETQREFLFNTQGELISQFIIVQNNMDIFNF